MKSRTRLILIALAGAAILAGFFNTRIPPATGHDAPPTPPQRKTPPPPPGIPDTPVVTLPIAASAANLNSAETTAQEDISTIDLVLSQYRKQLGGNPVGENEEITAALLGRNTKRLGYLPADIPAVDPAGRLIDRWGTPYFFHALSGSHMEISSAGPDRKHHTEDDLHGEP